jgi:hypothetical protein
MTNIRTTQQFTTAIVSEAAPDGGNIRSTQQFLNVIVSEDAPDGGYMRSTQQFVIAIIADPDAVVSPPAEATASRPICSRGVLIF